MESIKEKRCSKCKAVKPVSCFDRWNGYSVGFYPSCKECKKIIKEVYRKNNPEKHREWKKRHYIRNREKVIQKTTEYRKNHPGLSRKIALKFQYGISLDYFNDLMNKQSGCCAICFEKPNKRVLYVDHCHITDKIRGLLCLKCNSMLGFCNDRKDILNNAIEYLGRAV